MFVPRFEHNLLACVEDVGQFKKKETSGKVLSTKGPSRDKNNRLEFLTLG